MKKFNSFLAIAVVALTSVFGFTSCDKNDDPFTKPTTNDVPGNPGSDEVKSNYKYFGYQIFLTDDALQYGDYVITANYDGKSEDFKMSEGQSVTATKEQLAVPLNGTYLLKHDIYPGKVLTIPTFESKTGSVSFTAKFVPNKPALENIDADTKMDCVMCYGYFGTNISNYSIDIFKNGDKSLTAGILYKSDAFCNHGVKADAIESYLQRHTSFIEYSFE